MKRILLALFAALGLALGSGTALAQHSGGGHGGGGGGHSGGWSGGGHSGGWHGGGWHGGHGHGGSHFVWGVGIGFPGYWGWGYPYYGYPYYAGYPYYYGASYPYYADEPYYGVYDPAPGSYIQRDMGSAPSSSAPAGENQYSYYCPDPAGYYPQIQSCAKGWLKVVPDSGPRPSPR